RVLPRSQLDCVDGHESGGPALPAGLWRRKASARHADRAGHHFRGGGGNRGSVMQGPKDAPAKALVWTQARKPDRDGHEHYQAKTAAGCYSVAAEYQPRKGFIGYRVTQSVAGKRPVIASSMTVDEGKALAQRDYEQGDADERTRQALQPITIRVPLR